MQIHIFIVILLLLTIAVSSDQISVSAHDWSFYVVKRGGKCRETDYAEYLCPSPQVCVKSRIHWNSPRYLGHKYGGRCTDMNELPPHCSVPFCTKNGADKACVLDKNIVLTCHAWATATPKNAGGVVAPLVLKCKDAEDCPVTCWHRPPKASNGKIFCNLCKLRVYSCKNNFKVFGPV